MNEKQHSCAELRDTVIELKRGIRQLSALMDQATADKTDDLSTLIVNQFKSKVAELLA